MTYLRRELFILRYFLTLLRRDFKKYFTVAGITYFLGASGFYRSAKPAYYFCRFVDDLADGERQLPHGMTFEAFISRMLHLVNHPEDKQSIGHELTLVDAIQKLQACTDNKEVVLAEFRHFLRSMLKDYDRRVAQEALSQNQIDDLYDQSFSAVLHLALIGLNTQLERSEIAKLGIVQGKVYALEDITDELSRGIINVPMEVIEEAGLSQAQCISSPEQLTNSAAFWQWKAEELRICSTLTQQLLSLEVNKRAIKMIRILVKPLVKYIDDESLNMSKLHPTLLANSSQ